MRSTALPLTFLVLGAVGPLTAQGVNAGAPIAHACAACHGSHTGRAGVYGFEEPRPGMETRRYVAGLGGSSQVCLDCHATPQDRERRAATLPPGTLAGGNGLYLGLDFTNDHPLGRAVSPFEPGIGGFEPFEPGRRPQARARLPDTSPEGLRIECSTCHDPHDRAGPLASAQQTEAVCSSCHDPTTYLLRGHVSATCTDCHRLHDGEGRSLVYDENEEILCGSCHGGVGPADARAVRGEGRILMAPRGHEQPPGRLCTECHAVHDRR